jgi:hypothetical protein
VTSQPDGVAAGGPARPALVATWGRALPSERTKYYASGYYKSGKTQRLPPTCPSSNASVFDATQMAESATHFRPTPQIVQRLEHPAHDEYTLERVPLDGGYRASHVIYPTLAGICALTYVRKQGPPQRHGGKEQKSQVINLIFFFVSPYLRASVVIPYCK